MINRIQTWVNENSLLATIVVVIVLAFSLFLIYRVATRSDEHISAWPKVYAFDVNSKAVYTSPRNVLPPMATKSSGDQPAGVWAAVFSCGDCTNESERFVGWLEKFDEPTKASLEQLLKPMSGGVGDFNPIEALNMWDQNGLLVADPANLTAWHAQTGDEGMEIKRKVRDRCTSGELKDCRP